MLVLVLFVAALAVTARVFTALQVPPWEDWVPGGVDAHGDPRPQGTVARLGTVRFRTNTGWTIRWLGDDRLVGGGLDGELVVWDAESGERMRVLPGHRGEVAIPPRRWSRGTWKRVIKGGDPPRVLDRLDDLFLADGGRTVVSTGVSVRTWNVENRTGRVVAVPGGGNVVGAWLEEDGSVLAYGWGDELRRFRLADGVELPRVKMDVPRGYDVARVAGHGAPRTILHYTCFDDPRRLFEVDVKKAQAPRDLHRPGA